MIMYWSVMDGKESFTPRSDGWPMTSRSDAVSGTARSDRGRPEPERASDDHQDVVQDLGQGGVVMVDSYLARLDSVTRSDDEQWETNQESNQPEPETDRKVLESVTTPKRKWPSYHTPANGLRIITWDEFVDTPDMLNGLFKLEHNSYISHDASKINVFFHDARMMHASLGSLSENRKSWVVFTEEYHELKSVRAWLMERVSVLVVTLHNKNHQRQSNLGETACCLVAMDPSFSSVREKINSALSGAMDSLLRQRNFCVILDLNPCVERWCEEVLQMRCQAKGAQIVVTNGDVPPDDQESQGSKFCQYLCLPFRLIQGTAYKVKRRSQYDDYEVTFDDEHIVLCTANTKLQAYAEKAQKAIPEQKRKLAKKRNTVTFTAETQTMCDEKDCNVVDVDDTERGRDDEVMSPVKQLVVRDDIIRDSERAGRASPENQHVQPQASSGNKNIFKKNKRKESKASITVAQVFGKQIETMRSEVHSTVPLTTSGDTRRVSEDQKKSESEIRDLTYRLQEAATISDEKEANIARKSDERNEGRESPEQVDDVRNSVQTLKLGNFLSSGHCNPSFTIDVFESKPNESLVTDSQTLTSSSSHKQQTRINKMLKDIMGPGSGQQELSSWSTPTACGFLNTVTADEESRCEESRGLITPGGTHFRGQVQTAQPFARTNMYSTLPVGQPNGARIVTRSADFDAAHHDRSQTPISPKKVSKIKEKFDNKDADRLFTPRFLLQKDRNCFSDVDPVEEFTDVDANAAASDTEGLFSPRVISVQKTEHTVSMDSIDDLSETDLEITECDTEDLNVVEETPNARAPKSSLKSKKKPERGQKGQYDSRRRYLALNSLRRKTKAKVLNSEIRNRIRGSVA